SPLGSKYQALLGTGRTKIPKTPRWQELKQTERCHNFNFSETACSIRLGAGECESSKDFSLPKTGNYRRSGSEDERS
ncbi:hypothetical protein J6590_107298, partial [Homalodisca vitripennis]